VVIKVAPGGRVTVVAHADRDRPLLSALGRVETMRRGGHVAPSRRPLRWLFEAVRRLGGRSARVRAWTRTWSVTWVADLGVSGGPVLGPFEDRAAAIWAEERWLAEQEANDGASETR
jgi:hypothetical protein